MWWLGAIATLASEKGKEECYGWIHDRGLAKRRQERPRVQLIRLLMAVLVAVLAIVSLLPLAEHQSEISTIGDVTSNRMLYGVSIFVIAACLCALCARLERNASQLRLRQRAERFRRHSGFLAAASECLNLIHALRADRNANASAVVDLEMQFLQLRSLHTAVLREWQVAKTNDDKILIRDVEQALHGAVLAMDTSSVKAVPPETEHLQDQAQSLASKAKELRQAADLLTQERLWL